MTAGPRGQIGETGATGERGPQGPRWPRGWIYALVALSASQLLLGAANVQYTEWRADRGDQKWCAIVASMDDTYSAKPPETDTGRQMAANMHRLRVDLKCKP